jgi:hypothetical protein
MVLFTGFLDGIAVVSTGPHTIHPATVPSEILVDLLLDILKVLPPVVAFPHPPLVGNHDHWDSAIIQPRNRFERSPDVPDIFNPVEIPNVFNDDPVAVEKDRRTVRSDKVRGTRYSTVNFPHTPKSLSSTAAQIA